MITDDTTVSARRRTLQQLQKEATAADDEIGVLALRKKEAAENHQRLRMELLLAEFKDRDETWCTRCNKTMRAGDAALLFTEGVKAESGGYQNDSWGCMRFAGLDRVCPACFQHCLDKHGMLGKRDPSNGLQEHFHAFVVKEEPDGLYARKFGNRVKLSEKFKLPNHPPTNVLDQLADQYNLPKEIRDSRS